MAHFGLTMLRHVQQFALIAVAGHMHGGIVSIDHTSAKLHQLVDDLVHAMLVARNQELARMTVPNLLMVMSR